VQTIKDVTAASSFNMSHFLTAPLVAGKICRSPFNEKMNNTPWLSLPSVKDTQNTLTKKVEKLCLLGVLKQQQASN
jgi:hypothetical protein